MKFLTEHAQKAYEELLAEVGRSTMAFMDEARIIAKKKKDEEVTILLSAASRLAEMQIDGLRKAVLTASEIDVQWTSLKGHMTILSQK